MQHPLKIKKYTLIDGFDKLDLSTHWMPSLKDTLIKETTTTRHSYAHPFLASPASYKFLPDMFRFLTGRRFRIANTHPHFLLAEPPTKRMVSKYNDYINLTGPHINDFYIDLLNLKEIINHNFEEMSSAFKFEDYFTKPIGGAPSKIILGGAKDDNDPNSVGISMEDYAARIKTTKSLIASTIKNKTISKSKITIGAFGASTGGGGAPGVFPNKFKSLKFPSMDPALMAPDIQPWLAGALFGFKGGNLGFTIPAVVLQLMFLRLLTPSNGATITPYHTYFVADFAKGTSPAETDPTEVYFSAVAFDKVKISSYYNYYDELYESRLPNMQHEWQLPNPYVYNAYKNLKDQASAYFRKLIVLGQDKTFNKTEFTLKDYIKTTKTSTLPEGTLQFDDVPPQSWPGTALPMSLPNFSDAARYRTILLGNKELTNSTETLKKSLPYGVEIDLGPKSPSALMTAIKVKAPLAGDIFLSMLANNSTNYQLENSAAHRFIIYRDFLDKTEGASKAYKSKFSLVDLQIFDLSAMLNEPMETFYDKYGKYINDNKNVNISQQQVTPGDDTSDLGTALLIASAVNATTHQIKGTVEKYLNDKKLSIYQIYAGKKCHTEVIAYEIVKRKNLPEGEYNPVLQSIFIPNTFGEDSPLSYLDTQVFYGTDYIYEIFAHTLVVGSVYAYTHNTTPPTSDPAEAGSADLEQDKYLEFNLNQSRTVNTTPYAVIVRAPYYNNVSLLSSGAAQKSTSVLDKPPLPPEISFQPYRGSANKILILLNQNYGEKLLIPNSQISITDAQKISSYKEDQKEEGHPPGHILYKTDDGQGTYEIYRITGKPDSWASFGSAVDLKKITLDSTKQSGIDDRIGANTNYYYFARFIDVHGNISNPSDIFKVRIVKEEATPPFMVLKPFTFKRLKLITRIPFKKYVKIALNDSIREIDGDDATTATVLYKPPGGILKKYKFRITSMQTGKKIDINVDMKNTIIDKFAAKDLATIGGDVEGAPIVSAENPYQSEAQKEGEKALTTADFGNNIETA
jgi:hypothetical protein